MSERKQQLVITGGSGTLGQAIALAFDDPDWVTESPGSADLDVRDAVALRDFFRDRPVDLLVCAAGITRDALLAHASESAWDEVWSINYEGAARTAAAVLPGMAARGSGHVVFVSSFSALRPPPGQSSYSTAKAALLGLASDLAARHGPSNIRINAILPGFLETGMTQSVSAKRRAAILENHTLGRFNGCREVAGFIRYLQQHLPHTSGQTFQLDSRPLGP